MNQFASDKYHTGDNFRVTVRSQGKPQFYNGMKLVLDGENNGDSSLVVYSYYRIHTPSFDDDDGNELDLAPDVECLSLYRYTDGNVKFPFAMKRDAIIDWCWAWLEQATFPQQPNHDGSNDKGFFLTSGDFWGHGVGGGWGHIVTIQPDWQWYGK